MREKHYLISEISEMVGYQNPTYFSQVFKSITGKVRRSFTSEEEEAAMNYDEASSSSCSVRVVAVEPGLPGASRNRI